MSRPFLALLPHGVDLAVDLGCGPGRTTRLLQEVTGARRAVGLDASADFVERARAAGVEAEVHDCTAVPFPVGPVELAYCRMLLSHLPDPVGVLGRWLEHAAVVALDEVHEMDVRHPVLAEYEEVVNALVSSRGATMEVGPLLDAAPGERLVDRIEVLEVPGPVAARIYLMNLRSWRDDPAVAGFDLDRLAERLGAVDDGHVRWTYRQVALSGRARTAG